ncbi:MAG: nucleotidyl transferase AbiEii/AbiGii toxin family protein [Planctomycetota bacterium]
MAEAGNYESRLIRDGGFAMAETGRFFEEDSKVHRTLRRVTAKLDGLDIPYALAGGMALNLHGYSRTTDDVDLLVTGESLQKVHEALDGLGYVPPFTGSKHLRDTTDGVKIEFLTTGGFPGDGKPKPVSFPDPRDAAVEIAGLRVLALPRLIELKLASGMSNAGRLRDLADVQELARVLKLRPGFAEELDASVREKFRELVMGLEEDWADG